ncbi:hypothetical protein CLCR_11062 [Cladophialophora carrionii]|uniref:Uncharacterized protein n=1 Tax=Cladophialophora carrionii TaxID=86049 RepID=A0A1C1CWQ8_9EURO|nr:hypothetical protein CLCR_11062 [Cladophialophora carrionii]
MSQLASAMENGRVFKGVEVIQGANQGEHLSKNERDKCEESNYCIQIRVRAAGPWSVVSYSRSTVDGVIDSEGRLGKLREWERAAKLRDGRAAARIVAVVVGWQ